MYTQNIKKILEYAVWAPSGDNSQPWVFKIENNILCLYNLPGKDNPYLNYKQSGSFIAHGALIENIFIASTNFGYEIKIELFPGEENLVAKIVFAENTNLAKHELFDFIKLRHTNRKPYENDIFEHSDKEQLLNLGNLKFVETQKEKDIVGKAGAMAEVVILENKTLHSYLFKDVVWNKVEEKRKHTGLYIASMEFNPVQKILFKLASNWNLMKIAIAIGFPRFIAKEDSKLYSTGSAMGIVYVDGNNKENYINAGRTFQKVWLKATQLNLSLQPVSATLFFAKRITSFETEDLLSFEHLEMMKNSFIEIKNIFGIKNENIAMMFRIGKAKPASARCTRISVEEKIF